MQTQGAKAPGDITPRISPQRQIACQKSFPHLSDVLMESLLELAEHSQAEKTEPVRPTEKHYSIPATRGGTPLHQGGVKTTFQHGMQDAPEPQKTPAPLASLSLSQVHEPTVLFRFYKHTHATNN